MESVESDVLSVIKSLVHIINLDLEPFIPTGCTIAKNKKGGIVELEEISLYFSKKERTIKEVLELMEDEFLANACFLDYLVQHKQCLSNQWFAYVLLFGATIYRNFKGELFVRGLFRDKASWEWKFYPLNEKFAKNYALVILRQ